MSDELERVRARVAELEFAIEQTEAERDIARMGQGRAEAALRKCVEFIEQVESMAEESPAEMSALLKSADEALSTAREAIGE